jgi:hypothetical protein
MEEPKYYTPELNEKIQFFIETHLLPNGIVADCSEMEIGATYEEFKF